ncbi:hypothetical protein PYCCODRAFT_787911 [Trametes coccinea BRFM310]|uniref:Uncharacterized protein n=1 Tax=Trametes coccinea (strain BRFM310) TaxID=1353009 RepID=A0A1Y2J289_TRAC3|nr:hypothetical protein PYCCODRAFT_787911 [Trametes coccinea BRFM310]
MARTRRRTVLNTNVRVRVPALALLRVQAAHVTGRAPSWGLPCFPPCQWSGDWLLLARTLFLTAAPAPVAHTACDSPLPCRPSKPRHPTHPPIGLPSPVRNSRCRTERPSAPDIHRTQLRSREIPSLGGANGGNLADVHTIVDMRARGPERSFPAAVHARPKDPPSFTVAVAGADEHTLRTRARDCSVLSPARKAQTPHQLRPEQLPQGTIMPSGHRSPRTSARASRVRPIESQECTFDGGQPVAVDLADAPPSRDRLQRVDAGSSASASGRT